MERCPNCGTPARPGAKFCTTCGFRFPGDASDGEPGNEQTDTMSSNIDEEAGLFPGATADGWPSPPPQAEVVRSSWDETSVAPAQVAAEPAETIQVDAASDSWTTGAVDSWPGRPDPAPTDTSQVESEPQYEETSETLFVPTSDDATGDQTRSGDAVGRAMRLLDELRDAITEIGPHSTVDLSGVISELEVAVNPPGAMAPDDVAELRDALVTARERPRDVDTILDLTTRIDAMLALVIAYDRTVAAIERSLDALRR